MATLRKVSAANRRKCAEATRCAILEAARARFAANGYENTGLREIASDAGIDAALICRYFGTKQDLLAAILAAQSDDCAAVLSGLRGDIGAGLAKILLKKKVGDGATDLLIVLRAASSMEAAPLLRKTIEEIFTRPLQKRLKGDARSERAMLAASFVLGTMVLRNLLQVSGTGTRRSEREIAKGLSRAIQTVIDTPV